MDRRTCLRTGLSLAGLATVAGRAMGADAAADAVPAGPRLAAAPSTIISNGLIRARVLLPDAARGFFRGSRFDWAGIVSNLTLGGQEYYGLWFSKISPSTRDFVYDGEDIIAGPNTAITGPSEEFDNQNPPGFQEAAPGGTFVKIGVGGLRRPDAANYSNFRLYEIVEPGVRSVKTGRSSVEFRHQLGPVAGYGYDYLKRLVLAPGLPRLTIEHSLRNTGEKPIASRVYNHNFLTFGGAGIGPDLSITTPFAITSAQPPAPSLARIENNRLVYAKRLVDRERVTTPMDGFGATAADHRFYIENPALGAGVQIVGDRPLARVALWSIRAVMAVEPFVDVNVAPGQQFSWSHAYDYWARPGSRV